MSEVDAYAFRCRCIHHGRQSIRAGLFDSTHAAEVFDQSLTGSWTDTWNGEQFAVTVAHLPALAMVGHGKPMAFVANLLHQMQHGRSAVQHYRFILLTVDIDDLFALGDRRQRL